MFHARKAGKIVGEDKYAKENPASKHLGGNPTLGVAQMTVCYLVTPPGRAPRPAGSAWANPSPGLAQGMARRGGARGTRITWTRWGKPPIVSQWASGQRDGFATQKSEVQLSIG
jgi:hypothetical protein